MSSFLMFPKLLLIFKVCYVFIVKLSMGFEYVFCQIYLGNFFPHSVNCQFIFLTMSLDEQGFVDFDKVQFVNISFLWKIFACPSSWRFLPACCSKCFLVLAFVFRSMVHLKWIFWIRCEMSHFTFLHIWVSICPTTIHWTKASFQPHWISLAPLL